MNPAHVSECLLSFPEQLAFESQPKSRSLPPFSSGELQSKEQMDPWQVEAGKNWTLNPQHPLLGDITGTEKAHLVCPIALTVLTFPSTDYFSWKAAFNQFCLKLSKGVSHPSANQAQSCLAAEIREDQVCSGWYGGRQVREFNSENCGLPEGPFPSLSLGEEVLFAPSWFWEIK